MNINFKAKISVDRCQRQNSNVSKVAVDTFLLIKQLFSSFDYSPLHCFVCKSTERITGSAEALHLGIAIPGSRDPGSWIPERFSIPKSRDYERPNPGISG